MKLKTTVNFIEDSNAFHKRNNQHFRIRSTSKDKFLSTVQKSNEKSLEETDQQNRMGKKVFYQKIKASHKQLRKIIFNSKHQRQKSQTAPFDSQNTQVHALNTQRLHGFQPSEQADKINYQNIKTQQSYLNRKKWVDINSIDTSEDIKMLDRITTLCDPFRMINQCDSKARFQRKSEQPRMKSMSAKKSRLTDKINTLVFQMAAKSKSKSGFKVHRNKFEGFSSTKNGSTNQSSRQKLKQENYNSARQNSNNKQLKSQNTKIETQNRNMRIWSKNEIKNINNIQKRNQLQISVELVNEKGRQSPQQKRKNINNKNILHSNLINSNQTLKARHKIKVKQINNNRQMDVFWSNVNQSLILAAQEEYVSKDLNQFVHRNMY